jgi:hypothetical protein
MAEFKIDINEQVAGRAYRKSYFFYLMPKNSRIAREVRYSILLQWNGFSIGTPWCLGSQFLQI